MPEVVVDAVAPLAALAGEAGRERVVLAAVALLLRRYTGTAEQVLSWADGTVAVDLTVDRPFADVPPLVRPATGPPPPAEPGLPLSGVVRCALEVSGPVWTVSVPDCPAGLAEPLHADLAALFAELAADPARSTADLLAVCAYERARPVVADPHPDAVLLADRIAAHRSIPAAFAAQVAEHPDRPAVLADDACLTYRELATAVARTAAALTPGGAAALLCGHGAATVTALLAALAAGKSYVPLDPAYPRARLADILLDSDAEVLLVDAGHEGLAAGVLADTGRDLPIVHIGQTGDADLTGLAGPAAPDDIAYLLYTSGSTGRPKGVVQSHRNVLFGIANHVRNFGITPEDRTSVVTSFGFDMAVTDTFGALLAGAAAVPVDVRNTGLDHLTSTLDRHRVSVYHSTPTVYRYLAAGLGDTGRLPHVRAVLLGGEEVTAHDVALARRHFAPDVVFVNGYGTTEVSFVAQNHIGPDERPGQAVVPVGHPMAGIEVVLVSPAGRPACLRGEVLARSPHVAPGYWRRPELTAARFVEHRGTRAYRTGDLAARQPDGRLVFLGRTDRLVKIRGFRVELGEVEARLAALPGVGQAAVVARPATAGEREIIGYVVPAAGRDVDVTEVRTRLAAVLPDFMLPRAVVVVPALPMTATGKLDAAALPAPGTPAAESTVEGTADGLERVVGGIWCAVLGLPAVPHDVSFAELGGHSLQLAVVQQRLRAALGTEVPMTRLFEHPTVAGLAAYLRGAQADTEHAVRRAADRMRRRREARR
ncbi:non-ribosomal peptide synthetase [Actinophytocola sp. KF-1]